MRDVIKIDHGLLSKFPSNCGSVNDKLSLVSPSFRGSCEAMGAALAEAKLRSRACPVLGNAFNGAEINGRIDGLTFFKLKPHRVFSLRVCSLLKLKLKLLLLLLPLPRLDILVLTLTLPSSKAIELLR